MHKVNHQFLLPTNTFLHIVLLQYKFILVHFLRLSPGGAKVENKIKTAMLLACAVALCAESGGHKKLSDILAGGLVC